MQNDCGYLGTIVKSCVLQLHKNAIAVTKATKTIWEVCKTQGVKLRNYPPCLYLDG